MARCKADALLYNRALLLLYAHSVVLHVHTLGLPLLPNTLSSTDLISRWFGNFLILALFLYSLHVSDEISHLSF